MTLRDLLIAVPLTMTSWPSKSSRSPSGINRRAAKDGVIKLELLHHLHGQPADDAAVCASQDAASQDDFTAVICGQDICDVQIVGHDEQVFVIKEFVRHGFGGGSDVHKDRGAVGNFLRATDGNRFLAQPRSAYGAPRIGC